MIYVPPKNSKAKRVSLLFMIAGFIIMGLSSFVSYPAVFQLSAIALIVAGIQLAVRFVLSDHRYIIDDSDSGEACLIVYKKQGRNDVKVCHISLSCVEDVFLRGSKKVQADTRFNYTQNISAEAYSVIFIDGDKVTEIIIEADSAFIKALECRAGTGSGNMTFVM